VEAVAGLGLGGGDNWSWGGGFGLRCADSGLTNPVGGLL
jgi:hypothetical protein